MNFLFFDYLVFMLVIGSIESARLVYHKAGNVTLAGLFGGRNCAHVDEKSLEEMASAIWTIEVLNGLKYLRGITIGLSLFETCTVENAEVIEEQIVGGDDGVNVGILTEPEIFEKGSLRPSSKVVTIRHLMNIHVLADLVVQLLTNLQWMNVDLFVTDSESVLNTFSEKTSEEGICVHNELLITNSNGTQHINNLIKPAHPSIVIVIIAAFDQITNLMMNYEKMENSKLIVLPSDFVFHSASGLPKHSVVLLPSMKDKKVLLEFIKKAEHQKDFLNHKEPTKSPLFIGMATTILKMLSPFKKIQDDHCEDVNYSSRQSCVQLVDFIADLRENKTVLQHAIEFKISPDDVANTLQVLNIEPSANDEMFLYIASLTDSEDVTEDIAVFQIYNLKGRTSQPILLMINDDLLRDQKTSVWEMGSKKQTFELDLEEKRKTESVLIELVQGLKSRSIGNFSERDSNPDLCRNFQKNFSQITRERNSTDVLVWRFLTWVSINASVGFMGIVCTLSIMFFVVSRFCKDDILEGSPYFTLVLMFSVVVMFSSSLPFHVDLPLDDDSLLRLICGLRIRGPPLVYAMPFSLLLSRSLMLASSESKTNFVSHINGYIQTTLCFFMFGVQVSLTTQEWMWETVENSLSCSWAYPPYKLILELGYDILLLVMLTFTSPFIIRSRRNYKEGLFFSISVFFIIVVWSAWIGFYFVLPDEQKDAAVAIGLNSTGAVLLLFIFIPRTYLMVSVILRDRAVRSLPSLDQNVLRDVSDPNYVSQQSLNDLVFGTITYKSSETGLSNPNFYAGSNPDMATRETCPRESVLD